ncbi:MAG: DUF3783 domain-containing protein [Succiniclasticum sp.]|jgi:hypothetical protein|nr:DUF3783 domain-containing protein [Succiniclasticum sp.]MCI6222399.1 DUF3783 domain-containing protein [Selenomonadales bacterium]
MKKMILAFNFRPERLQSLRRLCMMLKVNCREVAAEEQNAAIGYLAEVKDAARLAVNPPENAEETLAEALEAAAVQAGEDPEAVKKAAMQLLLESAQKEMTVLCGFDMHLLNRFLAAVKKSDLREIELKAMLTPTNSLWSGRHLLQELAAEHIVMHQQKNGVLKGLHRKN